MPRRNVISNWLKRAVLPAAFLIAAVIGLTTVSGEAATPKCKPVNGHLKERLVTPPPNLTTTGRMIGGIHGEYHFTLTSLTPSTTPGVFLFTATSTIQMKNGDLTLTEAGALDSTSPGNYVDLQTITGGTDALSGASGQIFLFGHFDPAIGTGTSDYTGVLCVP